ncbi:MAG: hypothetical protein RL328_2948, partial [Acidobacteriota bacterium]
MSFHLTQTPTLQAVTTDDEQRLAQDIQARLTEAMTHVEAQPVVAEAMEASRAAAERFEKLRTAERSLHQSAKEAREQLDGMMQAALDALVDSAARGATPDWTKADAAGALEQQIRFSGR